MQPRSPENSKVLHISGKHQDHRCLGFVPTTNCQLRQVQLARQMLLPRILWNSDHGRVVESASQSNLDQELSEESHRIEISELLLD